MELFKVVWTDGFNRDHIAQRLVAENLSHRQADAVCYALRNTCSDPSEWWIVKAQSEPLWRGMEELV